ncbi:MAG: UDP-N-acetylmuramoyl-L-alanyl-D-glutamate--2,6-diaminopimelate ligase [Chloroflexi bacterium]|nr:UDP-N-acetylmuramoyl-L-alanyl-D-glutamate--2,6-diaminopimelate ligase [Chloroflexota bacterium]MCL5075157.1 UDP-N-acetylmuramoyl-L-alanyl-D-glutamate--2,6-diaminopimelate ligase [Chloroflexota bacterium]
MNLTHLLTHMPYKEIGGRTNVEVSRIVADSRLVQPGDLFVAIVGLEHDGHNFALAALARGAVAVVGERQMPLPAHIPQVIVADSRKALALLSAAFYHFPARDLRLIGVTGTDGKTTTVNLICAILETAGHKIGLISTVKAKVGDRLIDARPHTTTPEAPDIQRILAEMRQVGTEYAVIETTSHALDQERTYACDYDVAVITNVTHEHFDYHGTYERYLTAKAKLFQSLRSSYRKPNTPKVSVLNRDDPSFAVLSRIETDLILSYGLEAGAEVRATDITFTPSRTQFVLRSPEGSFPIDSRLLGVFNVYNILAAVSVAIAQEVPQEAVQEGVHAFKGVEGRMEEVDCGQDFRVIVDFAHTPNALRQVLELARRLTQGRVIAVFGCTGLRDRTKRPIMGEIAARLAEVIVLTTEDPRTEDPRDIMAEIAVGCERVGRREGVDYQRIVDRAEAIAFALRSARSGDVVIITGKGHERTMIVGSTDFPWSDQEIVRKVLSAGTLTREYE